MSGLLQRLAARATGSAWTVRSNARLPFASMSGIAEVQTTAPREPAAAQHPAQAGQDRATMPQQAVLSVAERTRGATPPLAHAQQMVAAEDQPTTTEPWPAQRLVAAARTKADAAEPPSLDDIAHTAHAGTTRTFTGHAPAPLTQNPAAHADPAPLLPTDKEHNTATAHQTGATAPHSGTHRAPHALPSLRQPSTTPAIPAEPAEVHVHIGRIEVTAISQPQPQKRAARERTQPLSLDAYLARRKEPS